MTTREYDITGINLNPNATLEKARRLADRCVKRGLSGGYVLTIDTRFVGGIDDEGDEYGEERHFLIVSGEPASYSGWNFVGLVEWHNNQPIISSHPDFSGAPVDRSSLTEGSCDHCGVHRNRKYQVIVENEESGERKAVGSACLKDFLGHGFTPTMFADHFKDEFDGFSSNIGYRYLPLESVLLSASRIIRKFGFVSRNQADINDTEATASQIETLMAGSGTAHHALKQALPAVDGTDIDNVEAVIEWVESQSPDSEWMMNLHAIFSVDSEGRRWVDSKRFGLAASAMGMWMRSVEEANKTVNVNEAFVGMAGEKLELAEAEVVSERVIHSELYGSSSIYTFLANSHRFEWITKTVKLEVGSIGTLKGTVKAHRDWNSKDGTARKTTVLTRCKFIM